jgi:hypothetical protein
MPFQYISFSHLPGMHMLQRFGLALQHVSGYCSLLPLLLHSILLYVLLYVVHSVRRVLPSILGPSQRVHWFQRTSKCGTIHISCEGARSTVAQRGLWLSLPLWESRDAHPTPVHSYQSYCHMGIVFYARSFNVQDAIYVGQSKHSITKACKFGVLHTAEHLDTTRSCHNTCL